MSVVLHLSDTHFGTERPYVVEALVTLAVPMASERVHLLRGHAHAAQTWAQAGADVVLGGHIHLPFVLSLQGLALRSRWCSPIGRPSLVVVRKPAGAEHSPINLLPAAPHPGVWLRKRLRNQSGCNSFVSRPNTAPEWGVWSECLFLKADQIDMNIHLDATILIRTIK